MESNEISKINKDILRGTSPSSVSSINSVRPLEWDSGADIGYHFRTQHGLSTVERMALNSGSIRLFYPPNLKIMDTIGNPLAESSPFIKNSQFLSDKPSIKSNSSNELPTVKCIKPLVDYSVLSDCSGDEKTGNSFHETINTNEDQVSENDAQSTIASLDGGSFEYVPGSVYNVQTLNDDNQSALDNESARNSSSDVNTLCNEVIDGVALVTRYVDNLNISNKRKVMKKVAQSLISNLSANVNKDSKLKDVSLQCTLSSNQSSLSGNSNIQFESKAERNEYTTDSSLFSESNLKYSRLDNSLKTDELSSHTYTIEDSSCNSECQKLTQLNSKIQKSFSKPNRIEKNSTNFENRKYVSNTCVFSHNSLPSKTSYSSYADDSSSYFRVSPTNKITKRINSASAYSLKEYLAKEREAQLLWIRSGIDHLNNLKKLYENQKILKDNLITFKKKSNSKLSDTTTSDVNTINEPKGTIIENTKKIMKSPKNYRHKCSSSDLSEKPSRAESDILVSSQNMINTTEPKIENQKKILSTRKFAYRKYRVHEFKEKSNAHSCKCQCKRFRNKNLKSANKENIAANSNVRNSETWKLTKQTYQSQCEPTHKPPISYTVLFDQKPRSPEKKYSIKKYVKKRSVNSSHNTKKTETSSIEFATLQEYLVKNRPEYVCKAEFRRQCLSEIGKLRKLRDKSRNELLTAINNNSSENNVDIIRSKIFPPPLSILKIFDEKSMKKKTELKYQQLPEIQNRKLEIERKENFCKNQIMAKVFTKKLQKKALRGKVNLPNGISVMST